MISTRDLSLLPDVERLRRILQSLATLDAIVMPEWEYRYYSFNASWSEGEQMGSMRNGSGDDFFAHFTAAGCWLKGFAHEYPMTPYREDPPVAWPGVLDVPAEFASSMSEAAFGLAALEVTFIVWRRAADAQWHTGPIRFPDDHRDPDGSAFLLAALDGRPETYQAYARDHFEAELELADIRHVFDHQPLTPELITRLQQEEPNADLERDLVEIGYPLR